MSRLLASSDLCKFGAVLLSSISGVGVRGNSSRGGISDNDGAADNTEESRRSEKIRSHWPYMVVSIEKRENKEENLLHNNVISS